MGKEKEGRKNERKEERKKQAKEEGEKEERKENMYMELLKDWGMILHLTTSTTGKP
jgi:hypothetical protein